MLSALLTFGIMKKISGWSLEERRLQGFGDFVKVSLTAAGLNEGQTLARTVRKRRVKKTLSQPDSRCQRPQFLEEPVEYY